MEEYEHREVELNKELRRLRTVARDFEEHIKPIKVFETDTAYECRNCNNYFAFKHDGLCIECVKKINYCPNCGRPQDWSNVK